MHKNRENLKQIIAERLREARERSGLSKKKVIEKYGLDSKEPTQLRLGTNSPGSLYYWELGTEKGNIPSDPIVYEVYSEISTNGGKLFPLTTSYLRGESDYKTVNEETAAALFTLIEAPEEKRKRTIIDFLFSYYKITPNGTGAILENNHFPRVPCFLSQNDLDDMAKQIDEIISLYLDHYFVNHLKRNENEAPQIDEPLVTEPVVYQPTEDNAPGM